MSEDGTTVTEVQEGQSNTGKWVVLALAVLFVAGSLYAIFDYRGRIEKLEKAQTTSASQVAELSKRMADSEANSETLASQLGITKKELAKRAAQLQQAQRAAEDRLSLLKVHAGYDYPAGHDPLRLRCHSNPRRNWRRAVSAPSTFP